MASNLWFFAALASSVLWGFSYALSEKIFKHYELPIAFLMMMTGGIYFVSCIVLALYGNQIKTGINIVSGNYRLIAEISIVSISYVVGAFLIYFAIAEKNATLANLIEISYPLFTLLFAWLMFRDMQLNWYSALGGCFIFFGIGLIFWKS